MTTCWSLTKGLRSVRRLRPIFAAVTVFDGCSDPDCDVPLLPLCKYELCLPLTSQAGVVGPYLVGC